MINLKVMSLAAAMALVLPVALPSAGFARDGFGGGGRGGGAAVGIGGGGGGAFRGGNWSGGAAVVGGGGGLRAGPVVGGGGGGYVGPRVGAPVVRESGVRGPVYGGGNWGGGHRHHRPHGGFYPGVVAGAVIGGALAANSYAYYNPYYYGNGYYDEGDYDDNTVAVVPGGGEGDEAYCAQRYRSWDPASRTYLGYDGLRHPCP